MRLISIWLCIAVALIIPAFGDLLIPGVTPYEIHYTLKNSSEYPDYLFLTSSAIWGWEYPELVINRTFGGGYKLDSFELHAMKTADIDPEVLAVLNRTVTAEDKNLTAFFEKAPYVTANLSLPKGTSFDDKLGIIGVNVSIDIQEISGEGMNATRNAVFYTFKDGREEERLIMNNDSLPEPGTGPA